MHLRDEDLVDRLEGAMGSSRVCSVLRTESCLRGHHLKTHCPLLVARRQVAERASLLTTSTVLCNFQVGQMLTGTRVRKGLEAKNTRAKRPSPPAL